jgi:hypothetical protein
MSKKKLKLEPEPAKSARVPNSKLKLKAKISLLPNWQKQAKPKISEKFAKI